MSKNKRILNIIVLYFIPFMVNISKILILIILGVSVIRITDILVKCVNLKILIKSNHVHFLKNAQCLKALATDD